MSRSASQQDGAHTFCLYTLLNDRELPVDDVIVVPAPAAETQARWDVTNDMYLNEEGNDTIEDYYCTNKEISLALCQCD